MKPNKTEEMDHPQSHDSNCPHKTCGHTHEEAHVYSSLSLGKAIAKICKALIRIIKLLAPLFAKLNKEVTRNIIVTVDPETSVWTDQVINATMNKVIQFYQKYKVKITYSIVRRSGIKSVKAEEIIVPATRNTLFLVDNFSNCPNCQLKGYENKRHITVRYDKDSKTGQGSPSLWVTVAHEIGHSFDLEHGGSLSNLMNEIGPNHTSANKIILTTCQVLKIKR